ncbi:MAG: sigma-54 dependent transcriptional regulator [Desulfobacteraceae bacterium]
MNDFSILVVDDEEAMRESLAAWLKKEGYRVELAGSASEALKKLEKNPFSLILLDIKMPGMDGLELLSKIKNSDPQIMVVMITAYGSIESAVQAMKNGASDYLLKPFDPEELVLLIGKLCRQKALSDENIMLKERLARQEENRLDDLIGQSREMREVFEKIEDLSGTETPVLITGETGTGKELAARAIHTRSERYSGPFVPINCGAVSRNLLESELFGHEKGAFTGAVQARRGRIEMANNGTLFLDEVGEISSEMQVNLLRVLEKGRFTRLGGNRELSSDFRLLCATHRDLEALLETGAFRNDFYFRINVINIRIPPLRDRRDDIPLLAFHFLKMFSKELGKGVEDLSAEALKMLKTYDWPGNVRELKNVMERAVVLSRSDTVGKEDLTFLARREAGPAAGDSLKEVEVDHIERILGENDWNISRSASILGIDRGTLSRKIKKYNLSRGG